MHHMFQIGQIVRAKRRYPSRPKMASYQILSLLPPVDDTPLYRLKSVDSGVEWIATQQSLEDAGSKAPSNPGTTLF
jgi:hypothetical protein